jgi:hypothetical protein
VNVAGATQFTNSEDFGAITHPSTVVLVCAGNRGIYPDFLPMRRECAYAGC